jgi:hypothetical protein
MEPKPGQTHAGEPAAHDGWEELAELTGGIRPDEVDALRNVRPLEQIYPLLHALIGRSPRDLFVRSAALESLVAARQSALSSDDLAEVLYWLTVDARDSVLRSLRASGWISHEPGVGTTLTDAGRWTHDVLSFLHKRLQESELLPTAIGIDYALQIGVDPIRLLHSMRSRLVALRDEIEAARASYSEVVLRRAVAKLDSALELSNEIRGVLDRIPLDQRAARAVARDIHDLLSQLLGKASELHASVVELGRQFLRLSAGLTTEQIVGALMRLTVAELGGVGREALLAVFAAPPLLTTEALAQAGELHILKERHQVEPVTWCEPPPAGSASSEVGTPPDVLAFLAELAEIARKGQPRALREIVPAEDTSSSFLRAALLSLAGSPHSGEGVAGQLGALALEVRTEAEGWPTPLPPDRPAALSALTPGEVGPAESPPNG